MSEIGLDVGQANELKLAFRKFDYTNGDVKSLTEGNVLREVRGVLRGTHKIVEADLLLEVIGTITVPATIEKFVASEKFTDKRNGGDFYLSDNFKKWFLDKVEEPQEETVLRVSRLTRRSLDAAIRKELGQFEKIGLSHFFAALADKQSRVDYTWTIAYIDGVNGNTRAVNARWCGDGWNVSALSVEDPAEWWHSPYNVLSRNS